MRQIFVSHSQLQGQRERGQELARVINAVEIGGAQRFRAYFAEDVHDTDGLSQHIFDNLQRSAGFLAVMHRRGRVHTPHEDFDRASVWIQQELAIVSFLNFQRPGPRRIRIRVFTEGEIKREGVSAVQIVNATPFERDDELPDRVRTWLTGPDFAVDPVGDTREQIFQRIAARLTVEQWRQLHVLMVLSNGTDAEVSEAQLAQMLGEMGVGDCGGEPMRAQLAVSGLVLRGSHDVAMGARPIHVAPAFVELLADELRMRPGF